MDGPRVVTSEPLPRHDGRRGPRHGQDRDQEPDRPPSGRRGLRLGWDCACHVAVLQQLCSLILTRPLTATCREGPSSSLHEGGQGGFGFDSGACVTQS